MKFRTRKALALVIAAGSASTVVAQNVVVPNANAGTAGLNGLNTHIRDLGNPRTAQLVMASSELATIPPGSQITGLTYRLWSGSTTPYPATAATWASYDIYMGVGVAPASATATFASNVVGALTQVRSGPLTIPAGAFSSTGTPRPWGTEITFTTPYVYGGGNLVVEVRHPGSNIVNSASDFLDCSDIGTSPNRAFTATGNTATVGAENTFTITRFTYIPGGPTGACCITATGACITTNGAGCTAAGGVYQGDGSSCGTVVCPQPPTGACCLDTGCVSLTAAQCTAAGGAYQGNSTPCATANCPITAWAEQGDAGNLPGNAQVTTGPGALNAIRGALTSGDVDMYKITICNAATFTAIVDGSVSDTQIFLFDATGKGVAMNDDTPIGATLQSALAPAGAIPGLTNGTYYIAISSYDNDPNDSGAQALWLDTPFNTVRAPDGPGAANPVASWDGAGSNAGNYSIALTGTCFFQSSGANCYANCDASTNPPCLNVNDFVCFNNLYAAASSLANCDASTNPPILNVNDFVCFNNRYAANCTNPCAAP